MTSKSQATIEDIREILKDVVWDALHLGQLLFEHDEDALRARTLPDIDEATTQLNNLITNRVIEELIEVRAKQLWGDEDQREANSLKYVAERIETLKAARRIGDL